MTTTSAGDGVFKTLTDFKIREVDFKRPSVRAHAATGTSTATLPAPLGPLTAFVGNWTGAGFNAIFRPQGTATPTFQTGPLKESDNVLELNLTQETLSFSPNLGQIPNRGLGSQADIILNGVPYLQTVNDVTTLPANGIHFEPGMWLSVPLTTTPNAPTTIARMASIPHGTTIVAQGVTLSTDAGKPTITPMGMTPFNFGQPTSLVPFDSQDVTNPNTARLPQDLSSFIAAGTITQAIVDDVCTKLRNQIANQTITQTITIQVTTNPAAPLVNGPFPAGISPPPPPSPPPPAIEPLFGGGPANIAFLLGVVPPPTPNGLGPNAQTGQMDAVFWIETVSYQVVVPQLDAGRPMVLLQPTAPAGATVMPSFVAQIIPPPGKMFVGGTITVSATQIQYAQKVILNFNSLSWPHVSVATLVPADPIPIPANLLPLT